MSSCVESGFDLADSVSMLAAVSVAVRRILNQIDNPLEAANNPLEFYSKTGEIIEGVMPETNCGCR